MKDVQALMESVENSVSDMKEKNKEVVAALEESVKASGKDATKALDVANKAVENIAEISGNVLDIQQKMADRVNEGKESISTLGDMVVQSEQFTSFVENNKNGFSVSANTIIGQDAATGASDETLVQPDRLSSIVGGAFRTLRIRDVLGSAPIASNSHEFTREKAWVNNAAPTKEGDTKPESDLDFELINLPVRTIAHFIKASVQILSDAPLLKAYIDTRMLHGAEMAYEAQILTGDGTGQSFDGMANTGNHSVFTPTAGESALDSINRMQESVELADYGATAIVMNTSDWHAIERLKIKGGTDDRYIIGDPLGTISRNLWGMPVVVSNSVTAGKAFVGDLNMAYDVLNRDAVKVEMFVQDDKNVQQNLVTIRAELRGLLATYLPAAVQYGNLVSA